MGNCWTSFKSSFSCPCNYTKLRNISKILSFFVIFLLILDAILTIIDITKAFNFPEFVLTLYFVVFAFFICMVECEIKKFQRIFYFFNFGWGKFILFFFLASVQVSKGDPAGIGIGIVVFLLAFILLWLTICYRKEEYEKLEQKLQEL